MKNTKAFFAAVGAGAFVCVCSSAWAQGGGPAIVSPEVHADRSVTFRLRAPSAQRVSVNGEFWGTKRFTLTNDPASTNGVWSVTTPPIEPDIYAYTFNVDGATVVDPLNTFVRVGAWAYTSQVYIPGERSDFLAVKNVPHGTVHEHWYHNGDINTERRVLVYTPPGFSTSKTYPVLYLLHGNSDDEAFWVTVGRANFVMDNLLAEKKAKPALIVMPFGHASRKQPGRGGPDGLGAPFTPASLWSDLEKNVIPLVEKEYKVSTKSSQRAIAGLSMGGGQSLSIALNHPDKFAYVAAFSSGIRANWETNVPTFMAEPQKTTKDFKLIWMGCGDKDGLLDGNKSFESILTAKGVKHEWTVTPDYAHEWTLWRVYLHDVLPKLFND